MNGMKPVCRCHYHDAMRSSVSPWALTIYLPADSTLAEAQRLFVDVGQALSSDRQVTCRHLVETTATAGPYHALPGACPLTGAGKS